MTKTLLPILGWLFWLTTLTAQAPTYQFANGHWFDGAKFQPGTWYSVGGKLTQKAPAKVDSIVDLQGRWAVPPLGDAFCSSLYAYNPPQQQLKTYADEGVLYLQVLANTQDGRQRVEAAAKTLRAPETVFANGGFTCTLGHPFLEYEAPAQGIRDPAEMAAKYETIRQQQTMLGDGYWFADSKKAVNAIWKDVLAKKPGVVSIYLLDAQNSGGKETKGLTPEVAKAVVGKAHRSGLRVFAHVETADDVRLGLKIGVDGFANLPGHHWDGTGDGSKYELTDLDLKLLAKKKTPVVALFSHVQTRVNRPNAQAVHAQLLQRLLANGVHVVIGSDDPQRTLRAEINYWFQLNALDNAQAIRIFCVNTPQAIFPKRKIGAIHEGYEATFLVLNENPLNNLLYLRNIAFRVVGGRLP